MIVHIVEEEKFLKSVVKIFEDVFPGRNIYLVGLYSPKPVQDLHGIVDHDRVIYENIGSREYIITFRKIVKKASLVIFHNLYKEYKLKLRAHMDDINKVAWVFWGAELYNLNKEINNLLPLTQKAYKKSLPLSIRFRRLFLGKLKRHYYWKQLKKLLKDKIDYVLTNIPEDVERLNKYSENNSKSGWFTYFSFDTEETVSIDNQIDKQHILVGNSSSETNNHFDIFEELTVKGIGDRRIYIPLSYGDQHYKRIVIKKAEALFGENAYPMVDFLSLKEYNDIIESCSVLIMNHKRQQAFNTILLAITAGCKIFLREENTIFSFLKREGFLVFSVQKDLMDKNALNPLSVEEQLHNIKLAKELYSYNKVKNKIKEQILEILGE